MKKALFISALVLLGMILGFLVAQNVAPVEKLKIVKETIVDTVYKAKIVKVPVEVIVEVPVMVEENEPDTIIDVVEAIVEDSVFTAELVEEDDTLQIVKDEMLKSETLAIIIIEEAPEDTLLQKLLSVEPIKQKQLIVEYWNSPVNYKGYKLSKSKLIVYGVKPLMASSIFKKGSLYYLKANNLFYELKEASDFQNMVSIPKPKFLHD